MHSCCEGDWGFATKMPSIDFFCILNVYESITRRDPSLHHGMLFQLGMLMFTCSLAITTHAIQKALAAIY
jgi:hypothetical protein